MTTAADLIAATRGHTDGHERGLLAVLSSPLTATAGEGTLDLSRGIGNVNVNNYLSLGLETVLVVDKTPSVVTILRGADGTSPTAHATGDLIRINPRFTDARIFAALNDDLLALSSEGLYRIRTLDRTWSGTLNGYDLATDFISIAELRWKTTSPDNYWPEVRDYRISANMPTTDFPSGNALFPRTKGSPGQTLHIRYQARFAPLVTLADDVTTITGLPGTALDIPPMGAAIRLMAGRPLQRSDFDRQGETRRPDEVRVSEVISAPGPLRALRASRVAAEIQALHIPYPTRLVRR